MWMDKLSSTNLESHDQWNAGPIAPSLLLFSESRTNSETSRNWQYVIQNSISSSSRTVLPSPAEAVFQRQSYRLSSGPGHVSLGLLGEAEAPAWSRQCTGSLPAAWGRNRFHLDSGRTHNRFCGIYCRVWGLTDWERVMPSISSAGTCCMGFNILNGSVSWSGWRQTGIFLSVYLRWC